MILTFQSRLHLALLFSFLVMTTNYYYGATFGLIQGGELARIILKIIPFLIFWTLIGRINLNYFILMMPVFYFAVFPIIFYFDLAVAYRQAINLTLAVPLLFMDYKKLDERNLLRFLIYFITGAHLLLYIFFADMKLHTNDAFVGMVGNPNSLGIISSFVIIFSFILSNRLHFFVVIILNLFFAVMSGSMLSVLFVIFAVFIILPKFWKIILSAAVLICFMNFVSIAEFLNEADNVPLSIAHVARKLNALRFVLVDITLEVGAHSIENRWLFIMDCLSRISTISGFIFGHNGFSEVYFTGDGGLFGYFATHGVVIAVAFIFGMTFLFYKSIKSGYILRRRAGIMLGLFIMSLLVNRTLDYWPMGVIFCLILGIANSSKLNIKE